MHEIEKTERHVSTAELVEIHNTMLRHNRTEGWIAEVGGEMKFFDAQPSGLKWATSITKTELEKALKSRADHE